jgi:hypothetical protein
MKKGGLFAQAIGKLKESRETSRTSMNQSSNDDSRVIKLKSNKTVVLKGGSGSRPSILDRIKRKDNVRTLSRDGSRERRSPLRIIRKTITKNKPRKRSESDEKEEEEDSHKWEHDLFKGESSSRNFDPYSVFIRHLPEISEKELISMSREGDNIIGVKVTCHYSYLMDFI